LNSSNWLLLHSMPTSINILHHTLLEVCHPLMIENVASYLRKRMSETDG
jgi:hypothetical protein